MSMRIAERSSEPEIFADARPEFTIAVVCDCGWRAVVHDLVEAERTGSVHESHFCQNRCG